MKNETIKYNYKDLIDAYRKYIKYKDKVFFEYHLDKYNAMSKAFGIAFEEELNDRQTEDYRRWFIRSVNDSLKSLNPFDGLMEAPEHIIQLYKRTSGSFTKLEKEFKAVNRNFQIELFELMYGRTDKVVSSTDLLNHGFDDSEREPYPCDFW